MAEERLFQVDVPYFCAGVVTDLEGRIVEAAPIMAGWKGKTVEDVVAYYTRKGTPVTCTEVGAT